MKEETLHRIRDETREWPLLNELPASIGSFTLEKSAAVDENFIELFKYESAARHCSLLIYFDITTNEYKLRVTIGLCEFCLTRFFDDRFEAFDKRLRDDLQPLVKHFDSNDQSTEYHSNSFIDALKLDAWKYGSDLPKTIEGFELFINPARPIEYTNGSFIIINYCDFARSRDLAIYYNILSDEFSAEARVNGHTIVLYEFDSKTLPDLEKKLIENLVSSIRAISDGKISA